MLTLDQLGEFVAKHHTRDLFRLETLHRYSAASDEDDFRRYLRGDPAPTAQAKRPWLDRILADVTAGRAWRRVHDFFVLDGEHVVRSRYDSDCRFACAEVIHPNSAAPFVTIAELLWNQATEFAAWWEAHPSYHRDTTTA
ncbi:MAG: DUF6879 family protein [Pseudonocardiaceae bacterium]